MAQARGVDLQLAERFECTGVVAGIELQVAAKLQRRGVAAAIGQRRQHIERFVEQRGTRFQLSQAAPGVGRMREAHADAARPTGGTRHVERALHPFQRGAVIIEVRKIDADVDGGRDCRA